MKGFKKFSALLIVMAVVTGFTACEYAESEEGDVLDRAAYSNNDYWLTTYATNDTQAKFLGFNLRSVYPTADGGYVSGVLVNFWSNSADQFDGGFLKVNNKGEVQNSIRIGNTAVRCFDSIMDSIQTSDGGYLAVGTFTKQSGTTDWENMWVVKLTSTGAVSWQKEYGMAAQTIEFGWKCLEVTDGYIVAGAQIVKISKTGSVVWSKKNSYGNQVTVLSKGPNDSFVGSCYDNVSDNSDKWAIFSIDASGNLLWAKNLTVNNIIAKPLDVKGTTDGNIIVTLDVAYSENDSDWVVAKLDPNGNILWQKMLGVAGAYENKLYVVNAADGGYLLAGSSSGINSGNDILAVKLTANGDISWQKDYKVKNYQTLSVWGLNSSAKGFVVSGQIRKVGASIDEGLLLSFDTTGNVPVKGADLTINALSLTVSTVNAVVSNVTDFTISSVTLGVNARTTSGSVKNVKMKIAKH